MTVSREKWIRRCARVLFGFVFGENIAVFAQNSNTANLIDISHNNYTVRSGIFFIFFFYDGSFVKKNKTNENRIHRQIIYNFRTIVSTAKPHGTSFGNIIELYCCERQNKLHFIPRYFRISIKVFSATRLCNVISSASSYLNTIQIVSHFKK